MSLYSNFQFSYLNFAVAGARGITADVGSGYSGARWLSRSPAKIWPVTSMEGINRTVLKNTAFY
jgi:hypothetical protein